MVRRDDPAGPAFLSRVGKSVDAGQVDTEPLGDDSVASTLGDDVVGGRAHAHHICDYRKEPSSEICGLRSLIFCAARKYSSRMEQEILRRWLREITKKRGLKQKVAKALGVERAAVSRLLSGKRNFKIGEPERIAETLRVPLPGGDPHLESEAVLQDKPAPGMKDTVPVVGYVGAGGQHHLYGLEEQEIERVPRPPGSPPGCVAVEIRGTSLGRQFNRWLAFYDDRREPVTEDLIGRLCVVGLDDGRTFIKELRRGAGGTFDLISPADEPMRGVRVVWAAKVINLASRS